MGNCGLQHVSPDVNEDQKSVKQYSVGNQPNLWDNIDQSTPVNDTVWCVKHLLAAPPSPPFAFCEWCHYSPLHACPAPCQHMLSHITIASCTRKKKGKIKAFRPTGNAGQCFQRLRRPFTSAPTAPLYCALTLVPMNLNLNANLSWCRETNGEITAWHDTLQFNCSVSHHWRYL